MKLYYLAFFLFVFAVFGTETPTVKSWTQEIHDAIEELMTDTMLMPRLQKLFNEAVYTEEVIDGTVGATGAAALLSNVFNRKIRHLENAVNEMENVLGLPTTDAKRSGQKGISSDISPQNFISEANPVLDDRFQTNVNLSQSTFKYHAYLSTSLASDANKASADQDAIDTRALDPLFKNNLEADPNLRLQYVGTLNGVLRAFPGHAWTEYDATAKELNEGLGSPTQNVDITPDSDYAPYDHRLTPWFAKAVSGAKDVVIIIDLSQNIDLDLTKRSVLNVLKTISREDWIAIITVGENEDLLDKSCQLDEIDHLVRGTPENLARMANYVKELKQFPEKTGKFSKALEKAFDIIGSSDRPNSGCRGAVLLMTANKDVDARDVVRNSLPEGYKLIIYETGNVEDKQFLQDLACEGQGTHHNLESSLKLEVAAGLYYLYLQRREDQDFLLNVQFQWGKGLRPDFYEKEVAFMTIAAPIFVGPNDNRQLYGVAAVDFTLYELKDVMDALKYGRSFAFLVNNEGETLYHPLQSVYRELELKDIGRDIGHYENFNHFAQFVRPGLFSQESGSASFILHRPLPKGDAVFEGLNTIEIDTSYFWQAISGMPFVIAMAYAKQDMRYRVLEPTPIFVSKILFRDLDGYDDPSNQDIIGNYSIINQNNCADENGEIFKRCKMDQYCMECTGDCECQISRWPVDTFVKDYLSTAFAPSCYRDPTMAFNLVLDPLYTRNVHNYINKVPQSVNPPPYLKSECMIDAQIVSQYFPDVIDAVNAGKHENTVWSYFGTAQGIVAGYPGNDWGNAYDPTRRPWYDRAIASNGKYTISTPYIDSGGAGLMNTISMAVFEERDLVTNEIKSNKIMGVAGYDYLYPTFFQFVPGKTAAINGGCSNLDVYNQKLDSPSPMCFLLDPAGLLLSHSDFLIDEEQAADLGDQVTGEVGVWPITNIFIGLKEPALAHALIAAGVLKIESNKVNEDNSALLSYYFIDETKFADDSVVVGAQPIDSPTCMESGAEWKLAYIENTNAYLLVVDKYQRKTDQSNCVPFGAAEPIEIEHLPCDTTKKEANPGYCSPLIGRCPIRRGANIEHMERLRETIKSAEMFEVPSLCTRELFVGFHTNIGLVAVIVSCIFIVFSLILLCAFFVLRDRVVMRLSSPELNYLICIGGIAGYVFNILSVSRPSRIVCVSRLWLSSACFLLLFGPLFAKTYRISRLFYNPTLRKIKFSNKKLFSIVAILGVIQSIILVLYTVIGDPRAVVRIESFDAYSRYVECECDHETTFVSIDFVYKGIIVLWGCYLVGATQRIDMGYNESKEIAISIYNIFLIGLITIPMKFFFELKYDASFLLVFVGFTWCVTVSLIATFVPKITKLDWGDAQSKFNSKYLSTKSHAVVNTFEAKDELNIGENQAWVIYPGRDVAKFSCFNPDLIRREISIMQEYIRKLDSALSNSMVRRQTDLDFSAKPKKGHSTKTKVGPSGSTYYSKSGKLVENNTRKHVKEASGEEKRCVERTSMKRSEAIHSRGYLPSSYIPKSVNK